jgi:hypothetical protein
MGLVYSFSHKAAKDAIFYFHASSLRRCSPSYARLGVPPLGMIRPTPNKCLISSPLLKAIRHYRTDRHRRH